MFARPTIEPSGFIYRYTGISHRSYIALSAMGGKTNAPGLVNATRPSIASSGRSATAEEGDRERPGAFLARRTEEGIEADDLLCSRNAWEEKGSLVVLLLAERARSECARSTRANEDRLGHP